ncbi:hypothetical protein [Massilia consociata]|uniref:Uncharacterized protein n=1 Tax=Massilia consociata TaxID=760117 RepID=A0ABV6FIM6_9BURK
MLLHDTWHDAWRMLGAAASDGLYTQLLAAWREPQRHYHTLQHLEECLALAQGLQDLYATPAMRSRFEAAARANLAHALGPA